MRAKSLSADENRYAFKKRNRNERQPRPSGYFRDQGKKHHVL